MFTHRSLVVFCTGVIFLSLNLTGNAFSQIKTLNRQYDPVIVAGEAFPEFNGVPVGELFLFAFDAATDQWQMISFQIDERDTSGSYFNPDEEPGLDANDEIAFMAKDAGDRALSSWIDDASSQTYTRYEIAVRDTSSGEDTAWVYLYRSSTLTPANQTDYVQYIAGPADAAVADTVEGVTYKIGNSDKNGLPNFMAVTQAGGGTGIDILQKQSIQIDVSIGITLPLDEENNFVGKDVQVKDGNIRVVRELINDIVVLPGQPPAFENLAFPVFYYAFTYKISGDFDIPQNIDFNGVPISIQRVQQSYNLNPDAVGMKFFSKNNADVPVDGVPDTVNDDIVPYPQETTWVMITGVQGTFINLYTIPNLGDSQKLFYEDDAGNQEYGNAGFVLRSSTHIFGPAPLGLTGIFPSGVEAGQEQALGNRLSVALDAQSAGQRFDDVTSVADRSGGEFPESFTLGQNYPNPFNPSTLIQYSLPANANISAGSTTKLTVYNLLGEEIVTLVDKAQAPGTYSVTWDGKDSLGRTVPSGIYVYRLKAGAFEASRKMLLLK